MSTRCPANPHAIPGFDIKRTIANGGMATAYLAVQHRPYRLVTLKVLTMSGHEQLNGEDREILINRFEQEGEIVTRLEHPNIVDVFGVGATRKSLYIYMEYLGGGDLASRVASGVHPFEALDLLTGVASALDYAHRHAIVHRDVKPSNVLFRRDGTPLLSDFGIAKRLNAVNDITTIGMLLGTPICMSPEQAEGRALDGRSDLYGLGIILFEMLTGRPPFIASSPLRVMFMHAQEPVPRLPADLGPFQPLCDRLLAKDREDRFASAEEVIGEVRVLRASIDKRSRRSRARLLVDSIDDAFPGDTTDISESLLRGLLADLSEDRLVLPTPRDTAAAIRDKIELGDLDDHQIAQVVTSDPALTAHLLRAANGAYYQACGNVASVRYAIEILGNQASAQIAALLSVSDAFEQRLNTASRDRLSVLCRSATDVARLSTAVAERVLARETESDPGPLSLDPERAGLGGLLHNLGAIALVLWAAQIPHLANHPERLERVIRRLERTVASRILERWRFPLELIKIVSGYTSVTGRSDQTLSAVHMVAAGWVLQTHENMSGMLDADGMNAPAIVALGLDEADVLDEQFVSRH